jgi:hypothetical protein
MVDARWCRRTLSLHGWSTRRAARPRPLSFYGLRTIFGSALATDRRLEPERTPNAIDNDYAVRQAFGNHYWPALYIADAQGRTRHHHFGEGEYAESEMAIQQLLAENGSVGAGTEMVSPNAPGLEAPADWATLRSAENYTGYDRTENSASPAAVCPASRTPTPSPSGWGSTTGPCPGTGPWRKRPPR